MSAPRVVSFNGNNINDGTNYTAVLPGLALFPDVEYSLVERIQALPVAGSYTHGEHTLQLLIAVESAASVKTLRKQLAQWFDPRDNTAKRLVIEDKDGTGDRYVMARCKSLRPIPGLGRYAFLASLVVDGSGDPDGRWREIAATTTSWSITASGQTKVVTNNGDDKAFPILTITATANKTNDYAYKRYVPVRWPLDSAYTRYPTNITGAGLATDALVTAGKLQADGDDLRVFVNGIQVDRWWDVMNAVNTKVWVNLDFQPKGEGTLEAAIASSGTVDTIDLNEDTSAFPSAGALIIDSEAFVYTGKNDQLKRFTGVTRAAHGTSMAAHLAGATVWWNQHEIYILYGNSTATAQVVDDDYMPAFDLASTNSSWDYFEFGDGNGSRPGSWRSAVVYTPGAGGISEVYTGNQGAAADPWAEIGCHLDRHLGLARFFIYHPAGITNANFQTGEKWADNVSHWDAILESSPDGQTWSTEYSIPAPSLASTWEIWSRNEALNSGARYAALTIKGSNLLWRNRYVESSRVTVTLDSAYTPTVTVNAEQGNYRLNADIENETTGEVIHLDFNMSLNQDLEVNTDDKTVIYLADDSNQFQALTIAGGPRRDWLPLAVGSNTLKFTDAGTAGVTIDIEYEERFYE